MSVAPPLSRLGRYEILGLLATGGMAEIFLARLAGPLGFEHPVVIKRILPHLARQRVFREMFLDEARIVSRIRHPGVVNVHELGDHESELFLVMEYLEGESLALLLKRLRSDGRVLPLRAALTIAADTCGGLHAAHELRDGEGSPLGIVHRDVSPQNLFVLYSGQVKVIDFGIAKAIDRTGQQTETGQVKGKFAYMAPEQIATKNVDRRADVFAMGAVLFELLSGKKLFDRDHELLVLKAVCEEPIPMPSAVREGVPPELDRICARALTRNPNERYQSAAEMRRDILAFIARLPGNDLPEEELSRLMGELFADRQQKKQELLRRARAGQAITHVPSADGTTDMHIAEPVASATALRGHEVDLTPQKRSAGRWMIAALAAAVLGTGGYLVYRAAVVPPVESAAPPSASLADVVTITIGSTPPGATITVDGRAEGQSPAAVRVPRGAREIVVRLALEGFEAHEESLVPSADARLGISLRPAVLAAPPSATATTSAVATSSAPPRPAGGPIVAGPRPTATEKAPPLPQASSSAQKSGFTRFE